MTRLKKILHWFLSTICCLSLGCSTTKKTVQAKGSPVFYIEDDTKQTFVGKGAKFSLRSLDDTRFLEHIEVSIDNEKFSTYENKINFDSEGPHILRYRSVDPVGNLSPIKTVKIYADYSAPEIRPIWYGEHVIIDGSLYINKYTKLRFDSSDRYSGVAQVLARSSIDGKVVQIKQYMDFKSDGPRKIFCSAVDQVGNQSQWQPINFTVDNLGPKTKYTLTGAHKVDKDVTYVNDQTTVSLESVDNSDGSGVKLMEYRIGGTESQIYRSPISLRDKETLLSFRAVDHINNVEKWQSLKLVHDLDKPIIKTKLAGVYVEDKGIIYAKPGFALLVTVKDKASGVARVQVSTPTGGFVDTKQRKFVFNNPGIRHFIVKAQDAIGNWTESEPFSIFIDNNVEQSTLVSKRELVLHKGVHLTSLPNSLDLMGNDTGVGVDYIEYGFDGKKFKTLRGSISLDNWKKGKRTLYYRAVDRLGNKEPLKQISIKIQTQSPLVDIFIDTSSQPNVPHSTLVNESKKGRKKAPVAKTKPLKKPRVEPQISKQNRKKSKK